MKYENLVNDFALRTRKNLEIIRQLHEDEKALPDYNEHDARVYEVTQLINSMLGLLVFPQQKFVDRIPQTSLDDLRIQGWPIPRVVGNYPQVRDLKQLVTYLRHAIAHFNLEFTSRDGQISGLYVWNTDPRTKIILWKAELTKEELEVITDKFIQLLSTTDLNLRRSVTKRLSEKYQSGDKLE